MDRSLTRGGAVVEGEEEEEELELCLPLSAPLSSLVTLLQVAEVSEDNKIQANSLYFLLSFHPPVIYLVHVHRAITASRVEPHFIPI